MTSFKHILVPTDFGPAADRALDIALDLAKCFESKVTLLHSTWLPALYRSGRADGIPWPVTEIEDVARRELADTLAKAKARHRDVESVLVTGDGWQRIIEIAEDRKVDLVVMGTHGRRGLSRVLIGSVAERVVRLSPVPVLTVAASSMASMSQVSPARTTSSARSASEARKEPRS